MSLTELRVILIVIIYQFVSFLLFLPDQRLSRKRSHISLDRLRRSMSLETCKSDTASVRSMENLLDRQTSSVKSRGSINPPETIPEEEIERIRRESLIPKDSNITTKAASSKRKKSMKDVDLGAIKLIPITSPVTERQTSVVGVNSSHIGTTRAQVLPSPYAQNNNSNATSSCTSTTTPLSVSIGEKYYGDNSSKSNNRESRCGDNISSTADYKNKYQQHLKHPTQKHILGESLNSQKKDEGLGESFDLYSEMSDSASRLCSSGNGIGGGGIGSNNRQHVAVNACPSGDLIELQPLPSHTSAVSVINSRESGNGSSSNNNKTESQRVDTIMSSTHAFESPRSDSTPYETDMEYDSDALEGVTFAMKTLTDDESDREGIDPLSFLSEYAAKRVTFM